MLVLQAAAALAVLALGLGRRPAAGAGVSADAALAAAAPVEGWLTDAQARRLHARAAAAGGTVVEIGSFRGRSTIVLAMAAGEVVAIDPHAGSDRGPQEIAADAARGADDHAAFRANLAAAGVAGARPPRARAERRRARRRCRARSRCSTSTAPTASARPATTSPAGAPAWRRAGRCSSTTPSPPSA